MNNQRYTYQKCLLWITVLLIAGKVQSQEPIGDLLPEVKVIGKATKNSILLRWGVTTPTSWKYANDYGYIIERKTITRGGEILKDSEVTLLTEQPIKPQPMIKWEEFTEKNKNAAIVAQALYGESFEVDLEGGGNAMVSIVNQASALEQRFSFALFAADQDFEVAKFSGLGFVDASVLPGEQYLYTIKTAITEEKLSVKPGGVYLGLQDFQPLPEPLDVNGIFKDQSVALSWNYVLLKRQYNNYMVERSTDGGVTFDRLDHIPVANLSEKVKNPSDRMFYLDSLPQNGKEYQYRVKGISPFGEVGPPSDIVKGQGVKALGFTPGIASVKLSETEDTVLLIWEFPEEGMEQLSHFELNRSDKVRGGYQVHTPNISKAQRQIEVGNLQAINYFNITAVGVDGSKRGSFPKMVQLDDSTPPAIPIAITGTIDSTGVVQLQWQQNLENDFLGYRVFRANMENEEFTQVTVEPISKSSFTDTVSVRLLNNTIYYKVQAFDKRYNPSEFSEVAAIKKPDIIPPTQPVFGSFLVEEGKVILKWIASSSEDALKTLVYRKEKGKEDIWELVAEKAIAETKFEDTSIVPATTYLYTILTMDSSGLESEPVVPLSITTTKTSIKAVDRFQAVVNVEAQNIKITWKYTGGEVVEYSLFKAGEEEPLTLYKVFKEGHKDFIDSNLKINTNYTYGIQALLRNGAKSPVKTINVAY
ncbi:hypothetical protein NBT05_12810 [Aquimarina sp. ERC-38]|uniref:hypothetical protein n=1 Tax=Aquimarina sp. ERC-38 TaxID=2949996 RepID=UPI002246D33A|nr:hypothetical protein [Aquimarina sp. ERC-38]UZO79830.1 hypothetical protein NBT05_12810 [Aquimarina sp. ERC-38]